MKENNKKIILKVLKYVHKTLKMNFLFIIYENEQIKYAKRKIYTHQP